MLRYTNFNPKDILLQTANKNFLRRNLKLSSYTSVKLNKKSRNSKIVLFPSNGKINFELLYVFYTLIHSGNSTIASEKLGISQPAISLTVKKLEKETGTLLIEQLNNTRKFIKLTSSGLIFFNYIQRLFQLIQESLDISNSIILDSFNISPRTIVHKPFNVYYSSLVNKNVFYTSTNLIKSNNISNLIKHVLLIQEDVFTNFETTTRLLIYKNKSSSNENRNLFTSFFHNNMNFKSVGFYKLQSIELLNDKYNDLLKDISSVEVQTSKALDTCLELKISSFIYWGSEF